MLSTLPEAGADEVLVERVAYLGFEVRVELVAADGRHFDAQLTHDEAERLELARGQIVYARLVRTSASGSRTPSRTPPATDNEIDPASRPSVFPAAGFCVITRPALTFVE